MLRCPKCTNEDEFIVQEHLWQRTRIQCDPDGASYTFIEEVEFLQLDEWGTIECVACSHLSDEHELRLTYEEAHPGEDDDTPIPYTLVDASVSEKERTNAPDATPQPGPLAQPGSDRGSVRAEAHAGRGLHARPAQ